MSGKLRVLISAILLTPAAAFGLGLGEIRLNSSLNEPLSAEIDLVAATPEELSTLNAQLASPGSLLPLRPRPPGLPRLARVQRRPRAGRTLGAARALARCDQRTVRFVPDRRELAARPLAARVHGAARSAGDAGAGRQPGPGADCGADDRAAAVRGSRLLQPAAGARSGARGTAVACGGARGERRIDLPGRARRHALRHRRQHRGRRSPGDPAHDDRALPREPGSLQRQHQPAACRRDPARAVLGRGRGHLVRRGVERSRPAECGLACRRRRRSRPVEARDSAGRRGRGCRGAGTERTRRIADRLAREGHFRTEAPARAAEPGTGRPAEEAGRRARRGDAGGSARSRQPASSPRHPPTRRPSLPKTTWRSPLRRRRRKPSRSPRRSRSRHPRPTRARRSSTR